MFKMVEYDQNGGRRWEKQLQKQLSAVGALQHWNVTTQQLDFPVN